MARTGLAAGVAALIAFPDVVRVLNIQDLPGVALLLAVSLGVTRVLALPKVDQWLDRFAPWLASEPPTDTTADTNEPSNTADTNER